MFRPTQCIVGVFGITTKQQQKKMSKSDRIGGETGGWGWGGCSTSDNSTSASWPKSKSKLAEVEIGRSRTDGVYSVFFLFLFFFCFVFFFTFLFFFLVLTHLTLSSFCFGSVSVVAQKPELNPNPPPQIVRWTPPPDPPSTGPPLRRTTLRRTAKNFALFFPLLPPSLGGLFVEFW